MLVYIYAEEDKDFIEENKKLELWPEEVQYLPFSLLPTLRDYEVSHLLVTGGLKEVKEVMSLAHTHGFSLGIIPRPKQKELINTLELPSKHVEAITLALQPTEKKIDLLFCNGDVVLQEVVIEDAPPLEHFDIDLKGKTLFTRIKLFWKTLKHVKGLKHRKMTIKDAKENVMDISAVGLVAVSYLNETFAAKLFASRLSASDGKMLLAILAPTSLMQYITYVFRSLVTGQTPKSLPNSIGYICSAALSIESKEPLRVKIDALEYKTEKIECRVEPEALALTVGEKFWEKQSSTQNAKDSVKIDHLPSDKESKEYLANAIPLFTHASKEQYTSLFTNLREEGRVNSVYITLLILSTFIATFGLFIDSSSVIIGAMLLAPLMQPIVSLSMGVLRQDTSLELNGIKSIFWGILAVLSTAALISLLIPIEHVTSEMTGRLSPTILDLFVAIISGVAAAYVKSNDKILGSLAGVAIAVALVPPIAVAGIGLGWGDWHMFMMAFLLFVTNLVGIVLAGAFTFALLGYSPLHLARKGLATWLGIALLVAIPLFSSFEKMKEDIHIQKTLSKLSFRLDEHSVTLSRIELIHKPKKDEIRCEVICSGRLTKAEKVQLKEAILGSVHKEAEVIVTFRYKL